MELLLTRTRCTEKCTEGTLTAGDASYYTLERPLADPEHPAIPEGRYPVTLYNSPRFKRTVLLLHGVPGREAIEIHAGNTVGDSKGCILVGKSRLGPGVIGTSRVALAELVELVRAPIFITIAKE